VEDRGGGAGWCSGGLEADARGGVRVAHGGVQVEDRGELGATRGWSSGGSWVELGRRSGRMLVAACGRLVAELKWRIMVSSGNVCVELWWLTGRAPTEAPSDARGGKTMEKRCSERRWRKG
jgi:hypothetical protein